MWSPPDFPRYALPEVPPQWASAQWGLLEFGRVAVLSTLFQTWLGSGFSINVSRYFLVLHSFVPIPLGSGSAIKVRHRYTQGQIFPHHTQTPRHCTHIRYILIPNHESGSILQNLWYHSHPWYINYKVIKLIITITMYYLFIVHCLCVKYTCRKRANDLHGKNSSCKSWVIN